MQNNFGSTVCKIKIEKNRIIKFKKSILPVLKFSHIISKNYNIEKPTTRRLVTESLIDYQLSPDLLILEFLKNLKKIIINIKNRKLTISNSGS